MVSSRARRIETSAALAVVGIVLTVIATLVVLRQRQHRVDAWLDSRAQLLHHSLEEALGDTVGDLMGFSALIEASEVVTAAEFAAYGARVDLNPSMIAYGFVVPVAGDDLRAFEASMQAELPGYRVTEIHDGELVPARPRETHYPVKYIVPGEYLDTVMRADPDFAAADLFGFDAASDPAWLTSIEQARSTAGLGISDFAEIPELQSANTFTLFVPVERGGEVVGFVGGAAVDVLLTPDPSTTAGLDWRLVTGDPQAPVGGWVGRLGVESVPWSLVVTPTPEALGELEGVPWWTVAIAGLAVTVLLVGFVDQLSQRVRTRRRIAELQRAATDKDRFLAAVSHEIRTPLTVITGFAHELRRTDSVPVTERSEMLRLVAMQAEEVAGIIEDLLVASRTDLSSVPVKAAAVDLLAEARRALPVTDHEIRFDESEAWATADPRRVRQVARNLVTNAIRHGGSEIEVTGSVTEGTARLVVSDTGPPIPPSRVARMFDAYTSTAGDERSVESIGLGLYVSLTLARLMGGDLTYDHDGHHSRFTLSLPSSRAMIGPVAARDRASMEVA
jgi:signal transduction histidine kinase